MSTMQFNSPMGRMLQSGAPINLKKQKKKSVFRAGETPPMQKAAQPGAPSQASVPTVPNNPLDLLRQIKDTPMIPQTPKNVRDPVQLYLDAQNQANTANDTRYRQAVGLMSGQGMSTKADNLRARDEGFGEDTQSLISRGLGGTTVLDSARRRRDEDLQRANQRVDESVADRTAGIVERRTDQAPGLDQLMQLLMGQSQAEAQNAAQSKKTSQTIFGPRGPNSFTEGVLQGGAGGGAGGGGGGGSGGYGQVLGGSGGGTRQGVQTYTNPGGSFWGNGANPFGHNAAGFGAPVPMNTGGKPITNQTIKSGSAVKTALAKGKAKAKANPVRNPFKFG